MKPILNNKIIYCIFMVIIFLIPLRQIDAAEGSKEIEITTSPEKVFFELKNLKPGDSITKTLRIKNSGNKDFNYLSSSSLLTGSEFLYNELDLKISDKSGLIYIGKLSDFKKTETRKLTSKDEEEIVYTIEFPYELGNEYQGLSTEVQFKFYVEGTLGGVLPVDNKLPTTGSEMFNLLATGAALLLAGLILFNYVKRKKLDTKRT